MPKWLHQKASKSARKAGLKPGSDRFNAYVYSTLRKYKERKKKKTARLGK